ncbi:hypothetical protein MRX96_032829 [Rhipicephalus microplus]
MQCATTEVGLSALGALNEKPRFLRTCTPDRGNCLAYKKKRNRPVYAIGFTGQRPPTPDCPEFNCPAASSGMKEESSSKSDLHNPR